MHPLLRQQLPFVAASSLGYNFVLWVRQIESCGCRGLKLQTHCKLITCNAVIDQKPIYGFGNCIACKRIVVKEK